MPPNPSPGLPPSTLGNRLACEKTSPGTSKGANRPALLPGASNKT